MIEALTLKQRTLETRNKNNLTILGPKKKNMDTDCSLTKKETFSTTEVDIRKRKMTVFGYLKRLSENKKNNRP